ncbi:MAG: RluA family pseudouridine synthase [Acutalibacteraceae bacterium]
MEILYEDNDIFVCVKPAGVDSESEIIKLILEQTNSRVSPVHRLDTAVSGVMVFAKNKNAAQFLSREIAEKRFVKQYFAVIEGVAQKSGELEDLLFKDSRKNKSYVVKRERRGVRKAKLSYETLGVKNGFSLLKITLFTGRSHQIRVQFGSRKMPIFGDGKYGSKKNGRLALYSCRLEFIHPSTGKKMNFSSVPGFSPFTEFTF